MHKRLLNHVFSNPDFFIDQESIPYLVRDIINMNWWNTCGYLIGYKKNKRVFLEEPTYEMKALALTLKEYYRERPEMTPNIEKLKNEIAEYISGGKKTISQLKLFSMPYRRNASQFFHKNGKPTWLDCTSRAKYAWHYVGQNGFIDFDMVCRLEDAYKINDLIKIGKCHDLGVRFEDGKSECKSEIRSQNKTQTTVEDWCKKLNIDVIEEKKWLFEKIKHVRTDPYKIFEKKELLRTGIIKYNENIYDFCTGAHESHLKNYHNTSSASDASKAIAASNSSRASNVSSASDASYASYASHASRASDASRARHASKSHILKNNSWFTVKNALGPIKGLEHPPVFKTNVYAIAGHWKINEELVRSAKIGWFDPFLGHGESPILAKRLGVKYIGHDTNDRAYNGYLKIVQEELSGQGSCVKLYCRDSTVYYPELENKFDLCYTSPPYFDFEEYQNFLNQIEDCKSYIDFHEKITKPVFLNVKKYLVDDGILAIQVEKDKNKKDLWIKTIESIGYELLIEKTQGGVNRSIYAKKDQNLLIFKKSNNKGIIKMNKIKITCDVKDHLSLDDIKPFQGNLKDLEKKDFDRLKKEILETGFSFPLMVWRDEDNINHCLGGHQRLRVLKELVNEGYEIEKVPVVLIDAKDKKEAKRRILQDASQYGKINRQGLYEFQLENDFNLDDLKLSFSFPDAEFNLDSLNKIFKEEEKQKENEDNFKTITFRLPEGVYDQLQGQLDRFRKLLYPQDELKNVSFVLPIEVMCQVLAQTPDDQILTNP